MWVNSPGEDWKDWESSMCSEQVGWHLRGDRASEKGHYIMESDLRDPRDDGISPFFPGPEPIPSL